MGRLIWKEQKKSKDFDSLTQYIWLYHIYAVHLQYKNQLKTKLELWKIKDF